jgi:hypothetical protein
MRSESFHFDIKEPKKFTDAGFFEIDEAMKMVTYSQDKALLNLSYRKYKDITSVAV